MACLTTVWGEFCPMFLAGLGYKVVTFFFMSYTSTECVASAKRQMIDAAADVMIEALKKTEFPWTHEDLRLRELLVDALERYL